MLIVAPFMLERRPPRSSANQLSSESFVEFSYAVGTRRPFFFHDYIVDDDGNSLKGNLLTPGLNPALLFHYFSC